MVDKADIQIVKRTIAKFTDSEGRVPIHIARRLVKETAYWHKHPSGPTRAPNDKDRVEDGSHGWQVKLGGNSFLVELAIQESLQTITKRIEQLDQDGLPIDRTELANQICNHALGSVSDDAGNRYFEYSHEKEFMLFGAHAISLRDFSDTMITLTKVSTILS